MRPTFWSDEKTRATFKIDKTYSKSIPIVQPWHQIGRCPNGTIPIRRTREEDILRAKSIQRFGKKSLKTVPPFRSYASGQHGQEYANAYVEGDKLYGAQATMSVWQPTVHQKNESSVSNIWVMGYNDANEFNTVEAGWQVNPQLYGDNEVRLSTYWTSDSYKSTGCYDLLCSGFIQVNAGVAVGNSISPLSVYGNPKSQFGITLMIHKDVKTGDWWLKFGDNQAFGYWPSSLFSTLSDSATVIQFGGAVLNSNSDGKRTETQMGSGHFPSEGFGKAAFFNDIKYINDQHQLVPVGQLNRYVSFPNCYDIQIDHSDDDWGNFFFYGGPGRNPNCT